MVIGSYLDEQIIRLRNNYKNRIENWDITEGVLIKGQWEQFICQTVFDSQVNVWIPQSFIKMPQEIAKVRYITEFRPQIIFTSPDYSENLAFNWLKRGKRNLVDSLKQMEQTILLHAPETVIYEQGYFTQSQLEGGWFEYKNFTIDEETYHILFLMGFEQQLLVGCFNCRMKYYDEWKKYIMKSFQFISLNQGGNERV